MPRQEAGRRWLRASRRIACLKGRGDAAGREAPARRYRIGTSPAPKAVKMRVSRLRQPMLTSGKSPTGR